MTYSRELHSGMLVEITMGEYEGYDCIANWAYYELEDGQWILVDSYTICMFYQDVPEDLLRSCDKVLPFDAVRSENEVAYGVQVADDKKDT